MGAAVKPIKGKARKRLASQIERKPKSPLDKARGQELDWTKVSDLFDATRGIENPCYVYFVGEGADGPVKIGTAKDPINRLRNMQTGNSRRLKIERALVGDRLIEQMLHDNWEKYAIYAPTRQGKADTRPGTEWFKPEIRAELYPIIETAALEQMKFLFK